MIKADLAGENMCVNSFHPHWILNPSETKAREKGRDCARIQNKIKKDITQGLKIDDSEFQNWSCLAGCPPGFSCSEDKLKRSGLSDCPKSSLKK